MKKLRIFLAVIVVLTMVFTVVSADETAVVFGDSTGKALTDAITIDGKTGDTITFTLLSNVETEIRKASNFSIAYDPTVWEIDKAQCSTASDLAEGTVSPNTAKKQVSIKVSKTSNVNVTSGKLLATINAKLLKDLTTTDDFDSAKISFVTGKTYYDVTNSVALTNSGTLTVAKKAVEPEKPVITKNETKGATIETEDTIYTNIFKGEYSAKAASNVVISEIGIKYHATDVNDAKAEKLSKAVSVEGGATVNFKAAILGVAADTELVVEPYTVYAFAK